ncbi:MAG: hypothetical protein E7Z92_00955 [Cyanobacteria bacterium SIG31]|nr:hypothetical protein [Cyanobacteria bacterium SIG31]
MINPINSISFKAFYTPKSTKFSKSQQKVFIDIKNKLKDEKKNFLVEPAENDSVKLSEISGVKVTGVGLDRKISYENAVKIGRYDKKNLFEIKDYNKYIKEQIKDFSGLLSFICFILPAALGILYVVTNKNHTPVQQTEKITTITKDSLQTIKKDSLQFAKDSLKIFK